jgi:hypothetical protein
LRLLLRRLRATEDAVTGRLLLLALVTTEERGSASLTGRSLTEQAASGRRGRTERLSLLSLTATEHATSSRRSLGVAEAAAECAASSGSRTTAEQRRSGLLLGLSTATKKTIPSRRLLSLTTTEH